MHSVSGPEAQVFHSSLRQTEEHNSLLGLYIVDLHFEPKFCSLWPLAAFPSRPHCGCSQAVRTRSLFQMLSSTVCGFPACPGEQLWARHLSYPSSSTHLPITQSFPPQTCSCTYSSSRWDPLQLCQPITLHSPSRECWATPIRGRAHFLQP